MECPVGQVSDPPDERLRRWAGREPAPRRTEPLCCGPQSKLGCESPERQNRAGNANSLYPLHLFPVVRQLLPALQTSDVGLCHW